MRLGVFFYAVALLLCSYTNALAQNTSNKGTEFWTAWMDHIYTGTSSPASQMNLYITSDVNTSGTVAISDGSFTQTFTVTANQITKLAIPASAFLGSSGKYNKGIHITSDKAIAVYAHIYASSVSGATLLLPVSTLGKEYQSINYTQLSNSRPSYSTFMVIGTEDNTTVEIKPSSPLVSGEAANATFSVTLNKGEVYQGLSNTDLTGTSIKSVSGANGSCKRIAVFSGSNKVYIGCGNTNTSSDNLFQQVYPTVSWGKNYITVPLAGRNYDVFRIIASDPTSHITVDGTPISYSAPYYEFNSQTTHVISADKPIQVVQYAVTQGNMINCTTFNEATGDPEMIYLTPIEQGLSKVTLYSASEYNITASYINVIIPTTGVSTFKLDGVLYNQFTAMGSNGYSYAQIPVTSGQSHTISSSEKFNAIAYGFGRAESYGYAAGTDLRNLNEYIGLQNTTETSIRGNGCSLYDYSLKLTLPYLTNSITWDFRDGTPPVPQTDYTAVPTTIDGKTAYIYTYPVVQRQLPKNNYTLIATVFNPTKIDDCGAYDELELDYNIADPNDVKFTYVAGCPKFPTLFTDGTDQSGSAIESWDWDFGDGTPHGTDQNPSHIYDKSGDYNVILTVKNENECTSKSATIKVHINKPPTASFTVPPVSCGGNEITFSDKSTAGDGAITTWEWDFGDGQTSTEQSPKHTYLAIQKYIAKLKVTDVNGCSSIFPMDIDVHTAPVAQFDIPDVCLQDSYANFKNKSTIADGTDSEMTYLWDFGDTNAPLVDRTSTAPNPKHTFTIPGVYNVTLTTTSKYKCVNSVTHQVSVNGSTPHTEFRVDNETKLCSSDDVVFQDLSTVSPGHLTKVEWYFDYANHPEEFETYYYSKGEIPADGKYRHNYGYFTAPTLSKTYQVKLIAYSGESCSDPTFLPITITINANPTVDVTNPGTVCQEVPPFPILTDTHGFVGTGTFTGKGINAAGLFDPKAAGVGITTVYYTFKTAVAECGYSTSFNVEVKPTPLVDAGPNQQMLEGLQTVTLKATASGNNLTYKWTPSIGLSRDDVLQPVANPTDDTDYTLTVTSADGCVAKSTTHVHVLKIPLVPNTFTPNNDGINDLWYIKHLELYPDCTVDIFSRDGEKIFSSVGYGTPWDGRLQGKELPVGVYYYIINPKSGRDKVTGTITIIR